nr:unnamed protein product [Naegleria fowleri]
MCFKEATPEQSTNQHINKQLAKDHEKQKSEIKLLLLGAGESGKSTIFKQMKIIHHKGYTPEECLRFKDVIYGNTLQSIRVLIEAMSSLNPPVQFANSSNIDRAEKFTRIPEQQIILNAGSIISPEVGKDIKMLWSDAGIQQVYNRRSEFQLNDSAAYYLNDIERLTSPNYQPTQQDVLRSRVKTVGIVEADFTIDGYKFKMIDVGGQRNERRKWIHVFDEVTCIVFVTALSEYDQQLFEDKEMNRMEESLTLFSEICASRYFKTTPIIIFFNKNDLFEEKIKVKDLNICNIFKEYTGGRDAEKARQFIINQFMSRSGAAKSATSKNGRQVYNHVTCATDTNNMKRVLDDVKNTILIDHMKQLNMM